MHIANANRIGLLCCFIGTMCFPVEVRGELKPAESIYRDTAVTGGLVVHLGCGTGEYTTTLRVNKRYLVHGLDTDAKQINAARERIYSQGLAGPVSVSVFDGKRLPYAKNTVNLLIVEKLGKVTEDEVRRVLAPHGLAWINERIIVKPRSQDIDEWTHFLHDSGGNAVAVDEQVGSPRSLRWVSEPLYCRSHEISTSVQGVVTAGGRIFTILDEAPIGVYEKLPYDCKLVARDAFNGKLLWKQDLQEWDDEHGAVHGRQWRMHPTLARRVVATEDRVYATLRFLRSPVSVLDAATGETLEKGLKRTQGTDEMVLCDRILLAKTSSRSSPHGLQAFGRKQLDNSLVAVDVDERKCLWERANVDVAPYALAAQDGRVVYYNMDELVCLDIETGEELWRTPHGIERIGARGNQINLVVHGNHVLFHVNQLSVFSLLDGEMLWQRRHHQALGVRQPVDLFVIDGTVWPGDSREGFDLETGQVAQKLNLYNLITPGHHRRCLRGKATVNYIIRNKRGAEFVDLSGNNKHMRNNWLRTPCFTGGTPANGLFYKPPDQCFCYPGVKVRGYMALSSDPVGPIQPSGAESLAKGPAYGAVDRKMKAIENDWPMYRRDNLRSGSTKTLIPVADDFLRRESDQREDGLRRAAFHPEKSNRLKYMPVNLKRKWEADLQCDATQPVVVGNRLWVAEKDCHSILCLDAASGRKMWRYLAGGRIDSSPTFYRGTVIFGCRDGFVYCLRASDGELVWKFRAAPTVKKLVSFEQLESLWPVPGSVLVQDGRVYFAAGRSSFLDGGILVYGLDAETGEVTCHHQLAGPRPDIKQQEGRPFSMDGALPDLMVSDRKKNLYMMRIKFDPDLNREQLERGSPLGDLTMGDSHLIATGGFLEDTGFDRTYWMHSNEWPGFHFTQHASKSGQILVFDDQATYAVKYFYLRHVWSPKFFPEESGYLLFSDHIDNQPGFTEKKNPDVQWLPRAAYTDGTRRGGRDTEKGTGYVAKEPPRWKRFIPVRVRAMVLAGDRLVVAGPPDKILRHDPLATFEDRDGGELSIFSTDDGKRLNSITLASPPVFDGISAAHGKLFIATADGQIICLGAASQ
ncbi:MAG: PQQ-binding-like beta-propeller repeat protein [Planctomycetota bacterium]